MGVPGIQFPRRCEILAENFDFFPTQPLFNASHPQRGLPWNWVTPGGLEKN